MSDLIIRKKNNLKTFENINKTASMLAYDVSLFLSEEIDNLNIHSHIFKSGLERCFMRVLSALVKNNQKVVIFPDSIPGFTMMALRKNTEDNFLEEIKITRNPTEELKEFKILETVISKFFKKNQQNVLLIENNDLMFALFPMKETKKYLQEMNLYITYDND